MNAMQVNTAQYFGQLLKALAWLETARNRSAVNVYPDTINRYRIPRSVAGERLAFGADEKTRKLYLLARAGGELEWLVSMPWSKLTYHLGRSDMAFSSEPFEIDEIENTRHVASRVSGIIVDVEMDPETLLLLRGVESIGVGLFSVERGGPNREPITHTEIGSLEIPVAVICN